MDTRMSEADVHLYRRVDEVLHYIWDPIGIKDMPEARNEYYSYLPQIFSLLKGGADKATISEELSFILSEVMGLSSNQKSKCDRVAEILLSWRDAIAEGNAPL